MLGGQLGEEGISIFHKASTVPTTQAMSEKLY